MAVESQLIKDFHKTYDQLRVIWSEIGFSQQEMDKRSELVNGYLYEVFDEIISDESDIKVEIEQAVVEYRQKVEDLQTQLKIDVSKEKQFSNLTSQHKFYKKTFEDLQKMRKEKSSYLKGLKYKEKKLCKVLDENEMDLTTNDSLVEADEIEVLELHIQELLKEKQERLHTVKTFSEKVNALHDQNQLKLDEFSSLNRIKDLNHLDTKKVKIDKGSMSKYRRSIEKLYTKREELITNSDELAKKIAKMWEEFNLTEPSLTNIVYGEKCNSGYTLFNYQTLKNEYQRCMALKQLFHKDYIEDLRDRIKYLWDEFMYERADRMEFEKLINESEITDDLYDKHREYLEKLVQYGTKYKSLLTTLSDWKNTWQEFVEFDIDYSDPNRFRCNRYSGLFEQKMRRKFKMELPKLERKLQKNATDYLKDELEEFLIEGMKIADFIALSKSYHEEYKNTMRFKRQLEFNINLEKDVSTPRKINVPENIALKAMSIAKNSQKKFENVRASIFSKPESPRLTEVLQKAALLQPKPLAKSKTSLFKSPVSTKNIPNKSKKGVSYTKIPSLKGQTTLHKKILPVTKHESNDAKPQKLNFDNLANGNAKKVNKMKEKPNKSKDSMTSIPKYRYDSASLKSRHKMKIESKLEILLNVSASDNKDLDGSEVRKKRVSISRYSSTFKYRGGQNRYCHEIPSIVVTDYENIKEQISPETDTKSANGSSGIDSMHCDN